MEKFWNRAKYFIYTYFNLNLSTDQNILSEYINQLFLQDVRYNYP